MTQSQKPVIIVTVGASTDTRPYTSAITDAGGAPVVILPGQDSPYLGPEVAGVVFAGGASLHPRRYGQDFEPTVERRADEARDHLEFSILKQALERGLPILGICRGLQLINVYFGGTLHQDVASQSSHIRIDHQPNSARDHLAHPVMAISGRLREILGPTTHVNSIHKQAIAKLGNGIFATVKADDGVIEGVETYNSQLLAVQWHPEELVKHHSASADLFTDLVQKALKYTTVSASS